MNSARKSWYFWCDSI